MKRTALAALAALALAGCQDVAPDKLTAPEEPSRSYGPWITLSCPGSIMVGQTASCSIQGYDASGMPTYVFAVTWSSDPAVLSVSGAIIQGQSVGAALVTASYNGLYAYASVQVKAPPQATTVTVSPTSTSLPIGSQRQFIATVKDQYGNSMSGQTVTWSTANTGVATVTSNGVVTTQGLGSTTLTAAVGGVTGTATVTGTHAVVATGANYGYEENVQVTATPLPAGSYYYQWYVRSCTVSGPCTGIYTLEQAGQNLTSVPVYVTRNNIYVQVRVDLKASSTGPVLTTTDHMIHGEGEPLPPAEPGSCFPRARC